MTNSARAGIGCRVKTGYATAILLVGSPGAPVLFRRAHILLADLDDVDSRQPYHAELERGARAGAAVVQTARRDAQRRAATALKNLLKELRRSGVAPRSIGLVVGSNVDPLTLGNPHIRAHALEGRFYREVLETSAEGLGLRSLTLLEREAFDAAAGTLNRSLTQLNVVLTSIGKVAGRPWRRDEQLATLAAWVALAS